MAGALELAGRMARWGVVLVQSGLLALGVWAKLQGALDTAMTLGSMGLFLSIMTFASGEPRRRARRMVE